MYVLSLAYAYCCSPLSTIRYFFGVGFGFCSHTVVAKIRNVYGCSAATESGVMGLYRSFSRGNLR